MSNDSESAFVYFNDKKAGILEKKDSGFEFHYDPDYLSDPHSAPISLSMPKTDEPYQSEELFPFFDGLISEGWLFDLASQELKIDKSNRFSILIHTGSHTIGAVTLVPQHQETGLK